MSGIVYLVRSGEWFKIGWTRRPTGRKNRLVQIAQGLPDESEVITRIETGEPIGLERALHARFAHLRGRGEWFRLSAEDVAWVQTLLPTQAEELAKQHAPPAERSKDYHASGFMVRLPEEYRDKLQAIKDRTGAPYAESVRRALDAYIKALEDGAK